MHFEATEFPKVRQLEILSFYFSVRPNFIENTVVATEFLGDRFSCDTGHNNYRRAPLALLSLVNQTVFRERACASERGRGGRKNTNGLVHENSLYQRRLDMT